MSTEVNQNTPGLDDKVSGRRLGKRLCELCISSGDMNIANVFCETCNKYQCSDCIEGHYKYPALAGHTFINLNSEMNVNEFSMKNVSHCKKHGSILNFYCKDDGKVICSTCFLADHRICKDVVEIISVASDADVQLKKVRNDFKGFGEEVKELIDKFEDSKESVIRQVTDIPDIIAEKRACLNTRLSNTKHELSVETKAIKSKYSAEFQEKESICKFILNESKTCYDILTSITQKNAKERFIAKKKIEEKYKTIKDACKRISNFEEVKLFLEFNEPFQLLEKIGNSLGNLKIVQAKTDQDDKDFRSVKMRMVRSKELEKNDGEEYVPLITGIDFLPDGRVVMVDNLNKKIKIIDEYFDSLSTPYELDYHPQDVAVMSHEEFAVTSCIKRKIDMFSANHSNEIVFVRSISSKYMLNNIAIVDSEYFLVGHHEDDVPLSLISRTGEEKEIDIKWMHAQYNLDMPKFGCQYIPKLNKIVICHSYENAIHIYDTELNTKMTVKIERGQIGKSQVVTGPFNNIFVCECNDNGSILQISSTGEIVTDHKLGIDDALAIGISKDYSRIMISTYTSLTNRKLHLIETVFQPVVVKK